MRKALVPGAVLALFFLAGCGSGGMGGLGDILGGGSDRTALNEIRGTVDQIDTSSRSILLTNVSEVSASLREGGLGSGTTARVYYDNDTPVNYQGQTYRPEDLERGDQVAVRVDRSGNRLHAESMTVIYDSSTGTGTGGAMTNVRGSVTYVDTSRRTIAIDRGTYGGTVTVEYDANTDVLYQGRRFAPADLERGDEIEVDVRDYGSGRLLAQDIQVLRSASETSASASTLRGTVRSIDTSRRLIQLDQANWISRFSTGTTLGNTVTVQYETNTSVEYQGQLYPVANLERGDVVDARVRTVGSTLIADELSLVRDVNARF